MNKANFTGATLSVLAILLMAGTGFAQSNQTYRIGVLPLIDNTGSGGADLATALARAVQADLTNSTQLEGRVISLNGANPSSIDAGKAVQLGKSQNVDVVMIGTVIEASSESSSSSLGGVSLGGFGLGGSKHTLKAAITLQGDLYDVTTGKRIDSIRITRNASKSGLGGDVSTSLGDISSESSFDNSPIGKAFHQAASQLVRRINGDQSKMSHCAGGSGGGGAMASAGGGAAPASSGGAAAASAGAGPGQASGGAQPNLVAAKIDFVPGEKTIFFDDFHDMPPGEPPPHWKVTQGLASLAMGGGVRELRGSANLTSPKLSVPVNFTAQFDFVGHSPQWEVVLYFLKGTETEAKITLHEYAENLSVSPEINGTEIGDHNVPCPNGHLDKVAFWSQEGRVRVYLNGARLDDVNQTKIPPIDHVEIDSDAGVGIRSFRLAESNPDLGAVIEKTGKYVTHDIYFDTDSAVLMPASAGVIKEISAALYKHQDMKLEIDGYTDSTGNAAHNLDLSKRRAKAVMQVLVSQFGIDQSRLTAKGYGAQNPIASNDTPEGRAENRRVEFVKQGANSSGSLGGGAGASAAPASDPGANSPASPAGSAVFSPEPPAYSLTHRDRLKVNGITVHQIVNIYRDDNKAMVKITVLPNAKNPKTVLSYSVIDVRTRKTWDWSPGVEECTTGSSSVTSKSSGMTWASDPFAEFPMGFRAPAEWFSSNANIPPGLLRQVGTGTALGFKTKIIAMAIPGQPREKLWVEEKYGLILKSANLGKDGRYHPDPNSEITQFSLANPPASVFALGGPCAKVK
jgi:OmpA-OmpF porin, OOP family